jgi:hypothetical protein
MRRRAILVAVLLLATGVLFLWLTHDPLQAARRCVRLGADEEAVTAAVGRLPDGVLRHTGEDGGHTLLRWGDGVTDLYVVLDLDGLAAEAFVAGESPRPTLWERVRDWWPW